MEQLKPCPFCGGKAKFFVKNYSLTGTHRGWQFGVYCSQCDIVSARTDYLLDIDFSGDGEIVILQDDRPSALETWNRRVDND